MARDWGGAAPEFSTGPHGGGPEHYEGLSTRSKVYAGLGVIVGISALLLIVQNGDKVNLEWLWFDFKAQLWLFFVASVIAGMILGQILMVIWRRSRQQRARSAPRPREE